jgi:hypothetical protein
MRRTVLALAAIALVWPLAPAAKTKHKQKSFEPASVADVRELAGRYEGVESEYWLDVRIGTEGAAQVALHEAGRDVTVRDVELCGARLRAVKVDADGVEHEFEATFGDRILNGDRRFGLLVEGELRIDDNLVLERVFYRRVDTSPPKEQR